MINGHAEIIEERCVKCGQCVSECSIHGNTVRDDIPRVRALLASGRPVVAVLASEFVAALHPLPPLEIERALESSGFFAVESTVLGEEVVAAEYQRSYTRPCASLTLRSTCPVTVDWVRKFYPQLVTALMPIVPPYIVQARLVKKMYPDDVAVVYVSPCYARKDEAYDPQFDGAVDAAIDFTELECLLSERKPKPPYATTAAAGARKPQPLKELSLTDGFPRQTLMSMDQTNQDIMVVRGLLQLDALLQAVMRGEVAPSVVDMLNCEGCIDGPAVRPGISVFAKRNIDAAERKRAPKSSVSTCQLLEFLPTVELVRSFTPDIVEFVQPTDEQIDRILADGEIVSRAEAMDCGSCGYDTCVEHATAIFEGNSSWEMCFPLQRRRMHKANEVLKRTATIDPLTGLGNRRVFDRCLDQEVARTHRYGKPASLLMMDIDGFKGVNDTYGHPVGDDVLLRVAQALAGHIRETDIAIRYGGDEFALVLPETDKTRAYAVAEKIRAAVGGLDFERNGDGSFSVTVSVGVATVVDHTVDVTTLLESADRALYQAKQSGRDQVRLSAG
jgi:diguanylate cyclase (GGDEF)-like protein